MCWTENPVYLELDHRLADGGGWGCVVSLEAEFHTFNVPQGASSQASYKCGTVSISGKAPGTVTPLFARLSLLLLHTDLCLLFLLSASVICGQVADGADISAPCVHGRMGAAFPVLRGFQTGQQLNKGAPFSGRAPILRGTYHGGSWRGGQRVQGY